jgi:hypothetical protein
VGLGFGGRERRAGFGGRFVLVLLEGALDEDEVCEDEIAEEEVGAIIGRGAEAEVGGHDDCAVAGSAGDFDNN